MDFDYTKGGLFDNRYYPPLRPLPQAIRKQQLGLRTEYVIYEPGNATRYEILFCSYSDGFGMKHNMNLVNFGTSMIIVNTMSLTAIGYMEEKLGINAGDCYALIPLINDYLQEAGN